MEKEEGQNHHRIINGLSCPIDTQIVSLKLKVKTKCDVK